MNLKTLKTESIQALENMDYEIWQSVHNSNELVANNNLVSYIKETDENEDKVYLFDYIKPLEYYCTEVFHWTYF